VDLQLGFAEEVEADIVVRQSTGRVDYAPGSGTASDTSTRVARDSIAGIENIAGSGLGDRLYGDDFNNIIAPGAGDDIVDGRGGIDTIDYSGSRGAVTVNLAQGWSLQAASGAAPFVFFTSGPNGSVQNVAEADDNREARDQISNIENVIGSALNDVISGNDTGNVLDGGGGNDTLTLSQGGDDTANGGDGDDFLFFGGAFTNGDTVDGGVGTDTLALLGNYSLTFDANDLVSIERLSLLAGNSAGTGDSPASYNLTTIDANVAAGQTLFVAAASLRAGETLVFNGAAETDGSFIIRSGAGDDTLVGGALADRLNGGAGDDQLFGRGGDDMLIGGLGTDILRGGGGSDIFRFESTDDSSTTAGREDQIVDFQRGFDKIDLLAIDADETVEGNQAFTFIGSAGFSGKAGELNSTSAGGNMFLVQGDTDGDGTADFAILVTVNTGQPLTASDFFA
jgi:Ca2+-binding RTX toxin-like protein